jgi:hypothetical protein
MITVRNRIDGHKAETPRSFGGLEADLPGQTSVAAKNPKLTHEALTELLSKVAEEKEIERVKLRARLKQLNVSLILSFPLPLPSLPFPPHSALYCHFCAKSITFL